MDSVPPELDLPFGDESSFKAWQAEATKAKPPNGVKPPPPPSDSDLPDANEQHLTAQVRMHIPYTHTTHCNCIRVQTPGVARRILPLS